MSGRTSSAVLVATLLSSGAAYAMMHQQAGVGGRLEHLQSAVAAYMTLRESVTEALPPLEISPDSEMIFLAVDAMAEAIRKARPSAKEGDVFDAESASLLRQRIRHTLQEPDCEARDVLGRHDADSPPASWRPIVHDRFDWAVGSFVARCLIDVLPPLPEALRFRFVGRDLVLVDIDADLVIDVLTDALPPAAGGHGIRFVHLDTALPALFLARASGGLTQRVRPSDQAIAREVIERLISHGLTGVSVSVESGIVTLRGTVPTLWMKERAREQALKAADVVTVASEVTVARGESDRQLAELVIQRLQRYVFLTIFDDADVEVDDGVVTLTGRVTMEHKADAFVDLASRVPGVQGVRNKVRTLPVSRFDDQLRFAIARQIYGDPLFAQYGIQANPPVHIIVEHGNVTLTGVVFSEVERRKAEAIARGTFAVMSVTNSLRTETED